jgi:CO dehydrogenase maturation factor
MDNEAGLEHLSRQTTNNVDAMVTVVGENPLSLDCARRIDELVADLKNNVRRKFYLINAAREPRVERIRERAEGLDMEYLGCLPRDPGLEEVVFNGGSVYDLDGGPAVTMMSRIMERLGEI